MNALSSSLVSAQLRFEHVERSDVVGNNERTIAMPPFQWRLPRDEWWTTRAVQWCLVEILAAIVYKASIDEYSLKKAVDLIFNAYQRKQENRLLTPDVIQFLENILAGRGIGGTDKGKGDDGTSVQGNLSVSAWAPATTQEIQAEEGKRKAEKGKKYKGKIVDGKGIKPASEAAASHEVKKVVIWTVSRKT